MTRNTLNRSAKLLDSEGTKAVTTWSSEPDAVGIPRLICVKDSGRVRGGFLGQAARVAVVGASDSSRARAGVR